MIEKTLKNQEKVSQDHLLFILNKRKHKIIKKSKFNKKRKA